MARERNQAGPSSQGKQPEQRQDWRRKSTQQAGGRGGRNREGWHAGTQPTPRYSQYRYLIRMIAMTAILATLLGTWFFYVIRKHRQVPLYAIVVTDYTSPYADDILPPNALAHEDLQLFEKMFERRSGSGLTRNVGLVKLGEGRYSQSWLRSEFPRILGDAQRQDVAEPGGPSNDTVMFYISAHGAVNDQGQACLLVSDSDPLDSTTWVPVVGVLNSICQVERFTDCKKIVFLDASRMDENWQMGMLCNTFPLHVAEAVQTVNDPNLVVINSADVGQAALTAPEQACTCFGSAVAGALAGEATRGRWLSRSLGLSDITLPELADYITSQVLQWSQRERAAYQKPTICWAGQDSLPRWKLADSAGKSVADLDRTEVISDVASKLKQRATEVGNLWERLDQSTAEQYPTRQPLEWATLRLQLSRLESLMLAGTRYDKQFNKLESDLNLELAVEGDESSDQAAGQAADRNMAGLDNQSLQRDVSSFALLQQLRHASPDVDPLAQQRKEWSATPDPKAKTWEKLSYNDAVDIGTQWLEQLPAPTRDDIQRVLELAQRCRRDRACGVVEVQFLKMLAHDTLPASTFREQIDAAMNCRFVAERAAAPPDPRPCIGSSRLSGRPIRRDVRRKIDCCSAIKGRIGWWRGRT